jgi:choline dehydrogenase
VFEWLLTRLTNDAEAAQRESIGGEECAHQTVEPLGEQLRQLEQKRAGLTTPGFNIVFSKSVRRSSGDSPDAITATTIRFMSDTNYTANPKPNAAMTDLAERVRVNQKKLASELKPRYDFIVCGSGSSGSVVARRLAENPDLSVLLLEAGGHDDLPSITDGRQWASNIKTERDWNFQTRPNPHLNGRTDSLAAGKVLGGGSSINAMAWARGHKSDWDYFAREAGDPAWSYDSVLNIYRQIEDWQDTPDPDRRGTGGLLFINSGIGSGPIVPAMFYGTRSVGIPTFDSINGCMMEGPGG